MLTQSHLNTKETWTSATQKILRQDEYELVPKRERTSVFFLYS